MMLAGEQPRLVNPLLTMRIHLALRGWGSMEQRHVWE
jgi:hypothetical protein